MKYKDEHKIRPSIETPLTASNRGDQGQGRCQSGNIPIAMIPRKSAICK
jgi:hypothetical protein